jgi:hypothetical protein
MALKLRDLMTSIKNFFGIERFKGFVLLVSLYLSGVIHWLYFYNFGRISFRAYDWKIQEVKYYVVLQQAVRTWQIPYHVDFIRHGTDRFLGIPETILSPQILFFRYMSIGGFVAFNTLLLYSIGFIGLVLIKKRYNLSNLAFAFMFLLFSFNGYITSNLAVGHSMWNGYFLLSFFVLYVLDLLHEPHNPRIPVKLSIVLFAILLQGSLQIFSLAAVFLILLIPFNLRLMKSVLLTLLFALVLSSIRIFPTGVSHWNYNYDAGRGFYPGFDGGKLLWAFFVVKAKLISPLTNTYLQIWPEYTLYIGESGLAFLVLFGILGIVRRSSSDRLAAHKIVPPMIVMTILSWGHIYKPIYNLEFPLNPIRAASRFIVVPFVFLIVVSGINFQSWLTARELKKSVKLLMLLWVVILGGSLAYHTVQWRIQAIEAPFFDQVMTYDYNIVVRGDPVYKLAVSYGAAVTCIALILICGVLLYYWLMERRRKKGSEPGLT